MRQVAVICCANDREKLDRLLLRSLGRQDTPHICRVHMNTEEQNTPIPQVYNRLAEGLDFCDWLVFVHQDFEFLGASGLSRLVVDAERMCDARGNVGVIGAAGGTEEHPNFISGMPALWKTERLPRRVDSLDECMVLIRPDILARAGGWCNDPAVAWHCYAVDLSMRVRALGLEAVVMASEVHHHGAGQPGPLLDMARAYVKATWCEGTDRRIMTTCGPIV